MQLSYNKLRTFGECRLKYRLAYVERLPQPPLRSLAFHRNLHATLRQYHHFARRDGVVDEKELLTAYAHIYDAGRQPEVRESKGYQEGEAILKRYCATENQKARVPALLEHTVRFAFGPYVLTGKIDRVDFADNNRYRIVDYKLDRTLPDSNAAQASRQLAFYHLLVEEGLGLPVESVSLYYLRQGMEQVSECSRSQMRDTVEWVDVTANAIHQEKAWEPTRGNGCLTCAFAKVCPARTGEPRPQTKVWQQGELLWDMNEEDPQTQQTPSATTATGGTNAQGMRQMTLDDYL